MLPSRFQDSLAEGGYVTQGFDRNLWVLTSAAFEGVYQRVMSMNLTDPLARQLHRMILGAASQLELDSAGRMLIPQNLRAFAKLKEEAILVGQGDYFEVWAPELWLGQEVLLEDAEANVERFMGLSVATR